jgi:hypothetical protein
MKGSKTEWDRVAGLGQILEEKVKDHADETEITAKVAEILTEFDVGVVGDPTGACHFGDGSCQELTELQCIKAKGVAWDGPGTTCPSPSSNASAKQVSTTR